jgi:restriction endonuclease
MSEVGWLVIGVSIVVAGSAVGWHAARGRRELVLTAAHLELAAVDSLTARQFARLCAALLRVQGYRKVRRARARHGEAGDLVGQAPDEAQVVIRCLRQRDPADVAEVSALREAVASGPHAGRIPILVTTALVTPLARALAGGGEGDPVTVADRAVLRHWMEQARGKIAGPGTAPRGLAGTRRDTRAVAGIVACAALAILAVAIQAALSGSGGTALSGSGGTALSGSGGTALSGSGGASAGTAGAGADRGATPGSSMPSRASASPVPASTVHANSAPASGALVSPVSAPVRVVRAFYAAISRHDWPQVWRLGGRNLGYGPYASYQGMVAGYAGTVRDELTDLRTRGSVVSGRFRAYHADGQVRAYVSATWSAAGPSPPDSSGTSPR